MYKVLLVDDERIILDGIAMVVKWAEAGCELTGTARNGLEALELIRQSPPDIIISDIRMPGLDGLELVTQTHAEFPHIKFIMLSGFRDFDYAKTAMQHGVRHYLLKPCNEERIVKALKELAAEKDAENSRERFVTDMKSRMRKVLPHVKEQFLKEFVTNKTYGIRDWLEYARVLELPFGECPVRFVLFQLEGPFEYEHLFAVKNICEDILEPPILGTSIGSSVLLATEERAELDRLLDKIEAVRATFKSYYKLDLTVAVSEAGDWLQARRLYNETLECLNHRFYVGEGAIITKRDIGLTAGGGESGIAIDEERFCMLVKSGNNAEVANETARIFEELSAQRLPIQVTKSYVIQLFMAMTRLVPAEQANAYMGKIPELLETATLPALRASFEGLASAIASRYYDSNKSRYSAIVRKVLDVVEEHLSSEELSLNRVAGELLYMNPDYLGKLFKKETGDKFSNYVMKRRIDRAVEQIEQDGDVKIFELAERFGFGGNPQYFSQVFKKYKGCSPSEYKLAP